MNFDLDFYKGKKVFVTGHTGFKGSWLCKMLANADTAIEMVVEWSKCWVEGGDIRACMDNEIKLFMES